MGMEDMGLHQPTLPDRPTHYKYNRFFTRKVGSEEYNRLLEDITERIDSDANFSAFINNPELFKRMSSVVFARNPIRRLLDNHNPNNQYRVLEQMVYSAIDDFTGEARSMRRKLKQGLTVRRMMKLRDHIGANVLEDEKRPFSTLYPQMEMYSRRRDIGHQTYFLAALINIIEGDKEISQVYSKPEILLETAKIMFERHDSDLEISPNREKVISEQNEKIMHTLDVVLGRNHGHGKDDLETAFKRLVRIKAESERLLQ
jgi:hypothetical protein